MARGLVGGLTAFALAVMLGGTCRGDVVVLVGDPRGRLSPEPEATRVNEPFAVAFDASGRMYGVEYVRGNRLFRVDLTGDAKVEFVAGRFHASTPGEAFPKDGAVAAADARFHGLHDVAVTPDGLVLVADTFNHRIRGYSPVDRTVTVVAGTGSPGFGGDGGPAGAAAFNQAYCGSLTDDGKSLLVADLANARLRRIDLVSRLVTTVAGNGKSGRTLEGSGPLETPLAGPRAACQATDGTIYLALREGNAVIAIADGKIRTVVNASGRPGYAGDGGPAADALLAGPKYVSLDRRGRVLIADTENHCIRRYDPRTGRIDCVAGMPTRAGGTIGDDLRTTQLARPHGCCLDPAGRLVIADSDNDRILAGTLPDRGR